MRVSLNTIKQYIDFELPPVDELVKRINERLGGVEDVIDLSVKYKDTKVVKVVECEKHPNADKLSSCKIDAGTGELIQVVCGAPNVHAGMWAVWLPPESIVPSSYGTDDEFKLGARELRGIVSNGMLASARELGIGDDHSGIVEIDENEWKPGDVEIKPGASFAEAYGLDDTIVDIENKMFTHRPDLFGQLGVAREIAGILGHNFTSPEWYLNGTALEGGEGLELEVFNDTPENVPRFMAVALKDVAIKPSPLWLQIELMRLGSKAINNIVDTTNYVMLLTAQPTHAYDYDKLRGHKLGARMAEKGEKITLLNGKTYELSEDDIVIADGGGAVGLAGIMGGGESEISNETKNVVLEVANFGMYAVRKSSMRHGIFTDALTRFNKGQSPFQNDRVLNLLMVSIKDVASGEQASKVHDIGNFNENCDFVYTDDPNFHHHSFAPQGITEKFINDRLGLDLKKDEIAGLLSTVEFKVDIDDDGLEVHYPFWRTDIQDPEDIVEEIGRLYGYDKLPRELPTRSIKPAAKNPSRELKQKIRDVLSRAGASEVLTYSFVHENILKNAGQDIQKAYKLSNALSPGLQYYRESLTPSLLAHVHSNIKAGHDEFAMYELNKIHDKDSGLNDENVPVEHDSVALVYSSKNKSDGAAFYQSKAFLEFIASSLGLQFAYEPLSSDSTSPLVAPFETKRSAIVADKATGVFVGIVGEYTKTVCRNFKLPDYVAGFELETAALLELTQSSDVSYRPLGRFPSVERDVSLRIDEGVTFGQTLDAVTTALGNSELETKILPVGIYQPENSPTKNITFRLVLRSHEKTLTSGEVNDAIAKMVGQLSSSIGAEVI